MFSRKVGVTPYQYLLGVRMEKAKELLGNLNYSITDVAAFCGFESASHFSNVFKKTTGYSPVEYKNK
jgi:transcriptional regulator GlxA family with amidase domain